MFRISVDRQIIILKAKIEDINQDKNMLEPDKKQLAGFYQKKLRDIQKQDDSKI